MSLGLHHASDSACYRQIEAKGQAQRAQTGAEPVVQFICEVMD